MQTQASRSKLQGYALGLILLMTAISLSLFAGAARWAAQSSVVNDRNNSYTRTVAAAEAASEVSLAFMTRDFLNQVYDPSRVSYYASQIPTNEWASHFSFRNAGGNLGRSEVSTTSTMMVTNLDSQFTGLYGLAYGCRVQGRATDLDSRYDISAAVQQDFQLATIPVFQFAIFYAMDLEVNPGADMTITGKVHGNANIYTCPNASLQYLDDVGATGRIYTNRHPDDPTPPGSGTIKFWKQHTDGVSSLTLPIATNNSPEAVRGILDVPPFGENASSKEGASRYYNNCDLVITTTTTNVIIKSGNWDSFNTQTPDLFPGTTNARFSFVLTNGSFWDYRESKSNLLTELDVTLLTKWMTNTAGGKSLNDLAYSRMNHYISSIYINDVRPAGTKMPAIRVINATLLPTNGLTVATRLPLYVKGHFNAPDVTVGLTNTLATKPASLLGDSITILSASWNDKYNSATNLSARVAANTTVNAAFLAGIVQTTNSAGTKHYSGGVENFPRFLEDWTSRTLTYNGSMVVMFPSQFAKNWWISPGTYYNAPTRKWAFDLNFLSYSKLPPATPQVRKLVRSKWSVVSAD